MRSTDIVSDLFDRLFNESSEGGDPKVPDEIEAIVNTLENKGYQVKYASPGYKNTRFNNDRDKNGVVNGKFVGTARVIFSRKYNFPNTPKGWTWKVLQNDVKALYVKPFTYNEDKGNESKEFDRWHKNYMDALREWAAALPIAGKLDSEKTEPDENFS